MKFQRSTIVLAVAACALFGAYLIYDIQVSQQEQTETEANQLFDFEETDVVGLKIATPEQTLEFVRQENPNQHTFVPETLDAETPDSEIDTETPDSQTLDSETLDVETLDSEALDSETLDQETLDQEDSESPTLPQERPVASSAWQMKSPETTFANESSIVFLLNLMATGEREQTLTIEADRQGEFGFDQPLADVEVTLADQTRHRLLLGQADFDRSGLYAQIEPQADAPEVTIHVVPISFENAVDRPLEEWKQPEELEPESETSPSVDSEAIQNQVPEFPDAESENF